MKRIIKRSTSIVLLVVLTFLTTSYKEPSKLQNYKVRFEKLEEELNQVEHDLDQARFEMDNPTTLYRNY